MEFVYRIHAIERMFERNISDKLVEDCIRKNDIIERYPDDEPYPSFLVLDFEDRNPNKPIHVVYAICGEKRIVITAYHPDTKRWNDDFRTRRTS